MLRAKQAVFILESALSTASGPAGYTEVLLCWRWGMSDLTQVTAVCLSSHVHTENSPFFLCSGT